ncbi:MAG: TetR/AcrR family transcriptional regulator, partial [Solirubrobacteraceae bacterium]
MTTPLETPAKPLRADARRNRDRLLEVARAAFLEHGVEGSLEEIARRAGVGVGTLYRHFPSREDLLRAVLADSFESLVERADELLAEPDAGRGVMEFLRVFAGHAATFRGVPTCVKAAV